MMDLRVLGSVAMDSAGLRDGLCVLPATPIAERAFLSVLKPPRLTRGVLNTLEPAEASWADMSLDARHGPNVAR